MKALGRRLAKLEQQAGTGTYEPPVIIRWIVDPGEPCDWSVAWVGGAEMRQFDRAEGETLEEFEARICDDIKPGG